MNEYTTGTHDKRLIITGHSLGESLATAANFIARYNYYKDNIQLYTLVFNPAGLHENTMHYNRFEPPAKKLEPVLVLFPLDPEQFPHILALSAIFAKYGRWMRSEMDLTQSYEALGLCLNEMIDYLDQSLFEGNLSQYITSKGEDRSVVGVMMGGLRSGLRFIFGESSPSFRNL